MSHPLMGRHRPSASSIERLGAWFDERAASRAVDFFPRFLRHTTGPLAGQPFRLEPWQANDLIGPLFGWKRRDGTRLYRRVYNEIPRKNGKSTLGAGIACLLLVGDGEPGAQVFSAAADRMQARIIYDDAAKMISMSPGLSGLVEVFKTGMLCRQLGASYRALSGSAGTKHGLNPHGILFDELHTQTNRELYDTLRTATGARRQPLELYFTTAGYDRRSICWEVHQYAVNVRDGIFDDPEFLPMIYAADEGDDWQAEETWAKANPNLSVSITLDYLRAKASEAARVPALENAFRRLHLNQWTEQATRWLSMELWQAGADLVREEDMIGRRCFGGLDLAKVNDLSAFILLFPPVTPGERWKVLCRFWIPEADIQTRSKRDHVPYDRWARDGVILTTPGNATDYDFIRAKILDDAAKFDIAEIAYDRVFAGEIVQSLMTEGLTMVPFGQGYLSMAAPCAELERLLLADQIQHGNHPVLTWCASNVAVSEDPAGNRKPDKVKSTERIDGIVALLNALGRAVVHKPAEINVYETRGFRFL